MFSLKLSTRSRLIRSWLYSRVATLRPITLTGYNTVRSIGKLFSLRVTARRPLCEAKRLLSKVDQPPARRGRRRDRASGDIASGTSVTFGAGSLGLASFRRVAAAACDPDGSRPVACGHLTALRVTGYGLRVQLHQRVKPSHPAPHSASRHRRTPSVAHNNLPVIAPTQAILPGPAWIARFFEVPVS